MDDLFDINFLIHQMISLDDEAWSYFHKEFGGLIYYCIKKVKPNCVPQAELDDCYQEIVKLLLNNNCKILKEIRAIDKRSFCSWLGVVATRRSHNFFRGINELSLLPDDISEIIYNPSQSLDAKVLMKEIKGMIKEKINKREQIVMFHLLDGFTLKDISQLMGVSITNVHKIKDNAILKIKKHLLFNRN